MCLCVGVQPPRPNIHTIDSRSKQDMISIWDSIQMSRIYIRLSKWYIADDMYRTTSKETTFSKSFFCVRELNRFASYRVTEIIVFY